MYKEKLVRCFGMNRLKEKNINDKIDLSYYYKIYYLITFFILSYFEGNLGLVFGLNFLAL